MNTEMIRQNNAKEQQPMANLVPIKELVSQALTLLMMVDNANDLNPVVFMDCINLVKEKLSKVESSLEADRDINFDDKDSYLNLNNQAKSMLMLLQFNDHQTLEKRLISNCLWVTSEKLETLSETLNQASKKH